MKKSRWTFVAEFYSGLCIGIVLQKEERILILPFIGIGWAKIEDDDEEEI